MIYNSMHSQTGGSNGGVFDGAVDGAAAQDFCDYATTPEADFFKMEPQTTQTTPLMSKWSGSSSLGTPESIVGSVPMQRTVSRSSAGSFKSHHQQRNHHYGGSSMRSSAQHSSNNNKSRHTKMHASSMASAYGLGGFADGTLQSYFPTSAGFPSVQPQQQQFQQSQQQQQPQYLADYPHGLTGMSSPFLYSMPTAYTTAPSPFHASQHINPVCTQVGLDFDTSAPPSVASSSQAWNSASNSRHSSPDGGVSSSSCNGGDDSSSSNLWAMAPMVGSPAESHGSSSASSSAYLPHLDTDHSGSDSGSMTGSSSSSSSTTGSTSGGRRLSSDGALLDEDYEPSAAATALQQKRSNSESSDSARDHHLYKNVNCGEDGLYHCPWEGQNNCNHKPEKLKCNYDKFVDSHLKPYRCKHSSCENARFSSTACLLRHEREAHAMHGHGDKPYLCTYAGCDRAQPGFGFPRQWNLKDHMRRVHRDDGTQQQMMHSHAHTLAHMDTPIVPSSNSSSSAISKNRKRKKDGVSSPIPSPSSRKSSTSRSSSSRSATAASLLAAAEAAQAAQAAQLAQMAQAQAQAQAQAAAEAQAFAAAEAEKARVQMEEWKQCRATLLDLVNAGLKSPHDPEVQKQLQIIQLQVEHLHNIAAACAYMHFPQA